MLSRIKGIFAPPVFPEDEDKTRLARVLNSLLFYTIVYLVLYGIIVIPFFLTEKLFYEVLILTLLVIMGVATLVMRRGRLNLAGTLFAAGLWLVVTIYLLFAGGMTSVVVVFYLVGTVLIGLLLGTRGALVYISACGLAGLVMVYLEISGHTAPQVFQVSPIAGWVNLVVALLSTVLILRLILNTLRDTLSLTRQHLAMVQETEAALRESEVRFSRLSVVTSEGIGITDHGIIVDANPQLAYMIGY